MKTVSFATGNQGKIEDMRPVFRENGFDLQQVEVDISEIHAVDVEDVAERKVRDSFEAAVEEGLIQKDEVLVVDDTGFFVESLGGFPGAEASFLAGTAGVEKLLPMLEDEDDRTAYFKTAIAVYLPGEDRVEIFTGKMTGKVPEEKKGESHPHLPYRSYFVPDHGEGESLAEDSGSDMDLHRIEALEKFLDWLESRE